MITCLDYELFTKLHSILVEDKLLILECDVFMKWLKELIENYPLIYDDIERFY